MLTFDTSELSRLDSYIRSAGQVSIVVHTHPDGDAIGSAVALRSYLMHRTGAQVMIVVPDRCPQNLSFLFDEKALLVASDRPEDSSRWISGSDLIFCLDINAFDRTGWWSRVCGLPSVPRFWWTITFILQYRISMWCSALRRCLPHASCSSGFCCQFLAGAPPTCPLSVLMPL